MKNLLLFIAFMSHFVCYSQKAIDNELQSYLSDYKKFNFEELKTKKFRYSVDNSNLPKYLQNYFHEKVTRILDFGLAESIYEIKLNYADNNRLKFSGNILHVFTKDTTTIALLCLNTDNKTKTAYINEVEVKNYISKHDSLYQSVTCIDDFVNQLIEERIYGYLCGNSPVIREIPEKDGLSFNDIKNIDTFRKWIRSYNPELQTYGVDAIDYVYRQPKFSIGKSQDELEKKDKELANYIKIRNSTICTCSGCLIGIYEKAF